MPLRPEDDRCDHSFPRVLGLLHHNISGLESTCADYEHLFNILRTKEAAVLRFSQRSQQRVNESKAEEIDRILDMAKRVRVSPTVKANATLPRKNEKKNGRHVDRDAHARNPHYPPRLSVPKAVNVARRKLTQQVAATKRVKNSLVGRIDAYLQMVGCEDLGEVGFGRSGDWSREEGLLRLALYKRYLEKEKDEAVKAFARYKGEVDGVEVTVEERMTKLFPVWFKLNFIKEEERLLTLAVTRACALSEGRVPQQKSFKALFEKWNSELAEVAAQLWQNPDLTRLCKERTKRLVQNLRKEASLRCLESYTEIHGHEPVRESLPYLDRRDSVRLQKWTKAMFK